MTTTRLIRSVLLGGVALAFTAGAASAQIEEVIVTAQKRSQDIQTVPIAVSAFTGESLKAAKIRDVQDLQLVSPSLLISTGSGETTGSLARIRGLGTTGNNIGLESAVGIFVDGVYRNRTADALDDLTDVERVEVLRGPQGTLFGKNTTAGAISIITRKPTFDPEAGLSLTGGNFDAFLANGFVSGAIIDDKLAGRLDASVNTRSGFIKDVDTGQTYNNRKRWNVRGQFLFTPTSDIEFRLIGDYGEKNENCCQAVYQSYGRHNSIPIAPAQIVQDLANSIGRHLATPYTGPRFPANIGTLVTIPPTGFIQDANFKNYRGSYNSPLQSDSRNWGVSGQLDWSLGFGTLTSITAYRQFTFDGVVDVDYSPADIFGPAPGNDTTKLFTQELQLKGKTDVAGMGLDWLFGAFSSREVITQENSVFFGSQATEYFARLVQPAAGGQLSACIRGQINFFPGCNTAGIPRFAPFYQQGQGYTNRFRQSGTSWSVFTHNTLHITDELSLTVGVRYNHEHKHGTFSSLFQSNTFGSCPSVPGTANDDGSGNAFLPLSLRILCPRAPYSKGFNEDALTGTANIAYQWTDTLMTYVSYSRGYKAGGFNLDRDAGTAGGVDLITAVGSDKINPIRFKPEKADDIEGGVRSEWFGRQLILNLTGFWTQFYNYQLNTFGGLGFTISNIGAVNTKGIEIEATTAPEAIPGLVLSGGATYADAKYGRRVITPGFRAGSSGGTDGEGVCGLTPAAFGGTTAALSGEPLCLQGRTLTQAPKWTLTGSASYQHPLADTGLIGFIDANISFRTQSNTGSNLDRRKIQDDLAIMNGQVGVRTDDGRYEVSFWGRNIFDRHYQIVGFDSVAQSGNFSTFVGEPATYGGTVTVHFD